MGSKSIAGNAGHKGTFVAGYGIKCYLISRISTSSKAGKRPIAIFKPRFRRIASITLNISQSSLVKRLLGPDAGRGSQVSTTLHKVQRPLLTPDEILRMRGPEKEPQRPYHAGFPAIYGRQPLYLQDETFAARVKIPPPKHGDSLSSISIPEVQIV